MRVRKNEAGSPVVNGRNTTKKDSFARRSAQTALYTILSSLARIIALQEIIWAGQAFMKGSNGISGAIWPLFFTGVYYLIFNGIMTIVLGRLEKKLDYFR